MCNSIRAPAVPCDGKSKGRMLSERTVMRNIERVGIRRTLCVLKLGTGASEPQGSEIQLSGSRVSPEKGEDANFQN